MFASMFVKGRFELSKNNEACLNCLHFGSIVRNYVNKKKLHHDVLYLPKYSSQWLNHEEMSIPVGFTKSEGSVVTCTSLPNQFVRLRIVPVLKGRYYKKF